MNTKGIKFLAVLAVLAMAFVAFAAISPVGDNDVDAATILPTPVDGVITLTEDVTLTASPNLTGVKEINLSKHTLTFNAPMNLAAKIDLTIRDGNIENTTTGLVILGSAKMIWDHVIFNSTQNVSIDSDMTVINSEFKADNTYVTTGPFTVLFKNSKINGLHLDMSSQTVVELQNSEFTQRITLYRASGSDELTIGENLIIDSLSKVVQITAYNSFAVSQDIGSNVEKIMMYNADNVVLPMTITLNDGIKFAPGEVKNYEGETVKITGTSNAKVGVSTTLSLGTIIDGIDVDVGELSIGNSVALAIAAGTIVDVPEGSSIVLGESATISNAGVINFASTYQVVPITITGEGMIKVNNEVAEYIANATAAQIAEAVADGGEVIATVTGALDSIDIKESSTTLLFTADGSLNVSMDAKGLLNLQTIGGAAVTGTVTTGTDSDVALTSFKGNANFSTGSVVMDVIKWDGGDVTLSNGDVLKVYSGTTGITGDVTINGPTGDGQSARILVESGQTLTVSGKLNLVGNLSMNNDGSIVGRGTIDVGKNATFYTFTTVSVYLTGEGTIITEDSMEDVEISGYLTSSMKATPTQRVIVTGNLTIRAGEYLVITGELVVPEGVTVSIEEGGLLMLTNPTAHAEIYGTIKASGKSAVAVADYNSKAAFTVASDANKVPVVIYGSVIAAKATADNVTSVDLNGLTEIYGDVTINTKAAANFAENAVVEATGKIVVNGTFSGTISNEGLIEINGAAAEDTTIMMAAADAVVDVKALKSADELYITDFGMYLMTDEGDPVYVTDVNTIALQNVGGVKIVEDIVFTLDSRGERTATNYTYMSGTTGFGDSKTVQVPTIEVTEGKTVVVAEELNLIKTVLKIAGDVTVSGKVTVNTEETFVLYGDTLPQHADIVISDGETVVYGMIQVTGNSLAPTTEDNMVAVKYTNRIDLKDVYYYTTLKTAIDSGEKDFEVLKRLLILEDTTVPAGVTVDATGKKVTIGDEEDAPEATLVISDGANLTAKDIEVIGTLYIANVDTGINCNNIVSDTSSFGEKDALYTNLYNALVQAESGDVVKITKKDNEVYLNKNSVIKTGVTLIIPGSKTLKIFEGVTLTVEGFLQNKGAISAYYYEVIDDKPVEKVGTFAEKAKADSTTHAASIKVSGMIESTTSMPYDTYKIPGAYYSSKTMYYITTAEAAAFIATTVDGCKIDLYGTLEIGDVAFIGTESKNLEINVYGDNTGSVSTTKTAGTLTVGEMTVVYGAIKFLKAGILLNGTFGTATGTVKLANVMTDGTTNMISDYIFADGDETVSVMAIQGSLKHSILDVDAKKATSFTFNGDVAVKSNLTLVGLYNTSVNGTVKIADDAFMGIFNGASLTITDANITIDGEVMVFDNGKMTVAKSSGTVPTVTVNGSFIAADGSDEDYDESGEVDVNAHVTVSDLAVVGGNVDPDLLTVMPTGTVIGALLETITAPSAAYTEFYVEGAFWKTVYKVHDNAGIDLQTIDKHSAPNLKNCVQDSSKKWVTKEGGTAAATGPIGTSTTAYANIIYDIYKIQIYTDAGVKSVSIDNKVLISPESGKNLFVTVENLRAGNHKVTYTLKDGYSGEAILYTSEHTILPNLSFETSGTEGISGQVVTVTLELSGTEPTPEPEPTPTPTPEEKSEWTVTTILLCVLVVLIAIMAVIVALRLNRN